MKGPFLKADTDKRGSQAQIKYICKKTKHHAVSQWFKVSENPSFFKLIANIPSFESPTLRNHALDLEIQYDFLNS